MLDQKIHNRKKQGGFTLIEVLIAMFVLSVGMLGSTALMLQGRSAAVKTNYEAKAMQMAQSMAEQMRANIKGVVDGNYNDVDTASASAQTCIATTCTTAEMALYDEYIWGWMLDQYLPSGSGTVTGVASAADQDVVFTITVNWTETRKLTATTGEEITKSYGMVFQP